MTKIRPLELPPVAETLLIPLYTRAVESQRPDALLKDEKAVEMVKQIDYDFLSVKLHAHDEVAVILRMREFDRHARSFLSRHASAVVVHIGCGLDTRFDRVDNGLMDWYDLDLPEVMDLRRDLIHTECARYHTLSTSVFDNAWVEEVSIHKPRPFLFLAEGVFPYFEESQIKSLMLTLCDHFPDAELVFDAMTPFIIWMNNLQLSFSKISARLDWGLKHSKDLENWHDGVQLLNEWFFFETHEPRVRAFRWMRHIPLIGKSTGIFHYRLG